MARVLYPGVGKDLHLLGGMLSMEGQHPIPVLEPRSRSTTREEPKWH